MASGSNKWHKKTTTGTTKAKKRRKKKKKKDSMGREWGDPDYGIPF